MVCPIFLIFGQNIALFFLLILVFRNKVIDNVYSNPHWIKSISVLFFIGALISVFFGASESISNGLKVLPNYFYWQFLMILLIGLAYKFNYASVARGMFIGVVLYAFYYVFLYSWLEIPLIKARLTPNTYAFHMICFGAPAIAYCSEKYGKSKALILLLLIVLHLIMIGRRSGSIFTFLTGFTTLYFPRLKMKYLLSFVFLAMGIAIILSLSFTEDLLLQQSPRVHELIYENNKVIEEDRSYLTRRLMVEKGMIIFSQHPWVGVGLNNFSNYDVTFEGNFVGAEFVVNKDFINDISAHNSYITILAEGGLILFIPFISLLLFNVFKFFRNYNRRTTFQNGLYWGFLGCVFSMYFVSGILNVNTWFLIGLVTAMSTLKKNYTYT